MFALSWAEISLTASTFHLSVGDACGAQRHGGPVRREDSEEGRGDPGWRCGVHHGGEEGAGPGWETTLPDSASLHLPNHGEGHGTKDKIKPHHNTVVFRNMPDNFHLAQVGCFDLFRFINPV